MRSTHSFSGPWLLVCSCGRAGGGRAVGGLWRSLWREGRGGLTKCVCEGWGGLGEGLGEGGKERKT